MTNQCYAYDLIEDSPERFNIILDYSKCRFSKICEEFNKNYIFQIGADYILCHYTEKISEDFKKSIIEEVIKCSVSIPITFLSTLVQESPEFVEKEAVDLISNGSLNCRIDKVNQVILNSEISKQNQLMKKAIKFNEKLYSAEIHELIKSVVKSSYNPETMELESKSSKRFDMSPDAFSILYKYEGKTKGRGEDYLEDDYDEFM